MSWQAMPGFFVSYRREDAAGHAGRLFDRLRARFGESVFMDVSRIEPGVDFVEALARRQAAELRDTRWDADVDDLMGLLASVPSARSAAAARSDAAAPHLPSPDPASKVPVPTDHRRSRGLWIAGALAAGVLALVLRQSPAPDAEIPEDLRVVDLTVAREPVPVAPPAGPTLLIDFPEEADEAAAQELADFLRRSDVPVSRVARSRRALSAPGAVLYSNEEHRELAERIALGSRGFLSRLYGRRVPIDVRHDPRVVRGGLILNLPVRDPGGP